MGILRVKLVPPAEYSALTPRPRLTERLAEARQARLTLLIAPAGFGKSSLMAQWYRQLQGDDLKPGWLTIDKTIADTSDFLTYLVASLSHAGVAIKPTLGNILDNESLAPVDYLVDTILGKLEAKKSPTYLFLDDIHHLSGEATALLNRIVEQAAPHCHFFIASRTLPDFQLARIRALGDLVELSAQELKFDLEESRSFLDSTVATTITDNSLHSLMERIEGWAAGLKLTSLAINRGRTPQELIDSFTGRERSVSDFFKEEVLSGQSEELRRFMLKTSILDRFCPALCDTVVESDNAASLIGEIETKGLFLFHLDEERSWYRYHHLFANYLSKELTEHYPEEKRRLHLRASEWFRDAGLLMEAMEHALRSGAMEYAAELLENSCQDFTYNGNIRIVAKFAARIPESIVARHPRTLLTLSWFHTRGLRFEKSEEILDQVRTRLAEMEATGSATVEQLRDLHSLLLHRELLQTSARDDVVTLEQQCTKLLDQYPDKNHPYLIGTTYCHLLLSKREQYKLDDLEKLWLAIKGIESRSNYGFLVPALRADVGPSLFFAGKTEAAEMALEEGLKVANKYAGTGSAMAALPALPLAELKYEANDLGRARELVDRALPSARKMAYTDQLLPGFLTLARLRRADGDHQGAQSALDEGMVIALDRGLERFQLALAAERIKYLLQDGDGDEAARYARSAGIHDLKQSPPLPHAGVTTRDELMALSWVRLALHRRHIGEGLHVAKHWRSFCAKRGAIRSLVRWNLLFAQLRFFDGHELEAQRPLREALSLAAERRYIRSFLDEGTIIHNLLHMTYGTNPEASDPAEILAARLLALFDPAAPIAFTPEEDTDTEGVKESLTPNELKIINLAGHGLRNRQIAERLGMTEGSIKWYMQQIYDKLGTRPRLKAIDRARRLGLIKPAS